MLALKTSSDKLLDTIKSNLKVNETILFQTQVFPLDYTLSNYLTAQLFLTNSKIFIYYDDQLEVYDLMSTRIENNRVAPSFELQSIFLEGNFNIMNDIEGVKSRLRDSENLFKFVIYQESVSPKSFFVRKDFSIGKSYQTWAMYQIIKSVQETGSYNPILQEIVLNKYMEYNSKLLLTIMWIGVTFVLARVLLLLVNLGYIESLIDLLFIIITIFQGIKVIKMYKNRLIQYKRVYLSYS